LPRLLSSFVKITAMKFLFLTLAIIYILPVSGQLRKPAYDSKLIASKHYLTVKVNISDATASDTLQILLYTRLRSVPDQTLLSTQNHDGLFVFKIGVTESYGNFCIARMLPKLKVWADNPQVIPLTRTYYWTAGDEILINLTKVNQQNKDVPSVYKTTVSGNGALKYRLALKTDSIIRNVSSGRRKGFYGFGIDGIDSAVNYLNEHKEDLSIADLEVLKADCLFRGSYGNFHNVSATFIGALKTDYNLNLTDYLERFRAFEKAYINQISKVGLARSYEFKMYAIYEAETEYLISHPQKYAIGDGRLILNIDNILPIITANYSGEIRDNEIINLFFFHLGALNPEKLKRQALNYITNHSKKRLLNTLTLARAEGTWAYKFNLPDTTGIYHSLLDFKGKVIFLDFYFVGCGGCTRLYQTVLIDVEKHYKNNPNVVFVSISSDANVYKVKAGIKGGQYNSSSSINLYTEGKGFTHDILKYYSITEYPQVALIDKSGRIARFGTTDIQTKDGLIKQIDRLLKE